MKRRRTLFSLGLLALAALIPAGLTLAAPASQASGHGALINGDGSKRQFSFSARGNADGTASGNATLINPAFTGANGTSPYQLKVDVQCMHVVGNIAIFGGTTRRTNDPSLVDAVFWTAQDNGEPGKTDKISRAYFWDGDPDTTGDPMACLNTGPNDFPLETIANGNIQVKSS